MHIDGQELVSTCPKHLNVYLDVQTLMRNRIVHNTLFFLMQYYGMVYLMFYLYFSVATQKTTTILERTINPNIIDYNHKKTSV